MSAGAFESATYQSDLGSFHRVKVQPETLELVINSETNDESSGAINSPFAARVSGSRRGYGAFCRTVTVRFAEGQAPAGYEAEGTITLPWLVPATFTGLIAGQAGTYLGVAVELIGKRAEVLR